MGNTTRKCYIFITFPCVAQLYIYTSCQGADKDIVVHYWKLKCDKNDGKLEVINLNQCAFYWIIRASQILSIEIHHTISKLFSMRISLRICYLVSLPDFVKFCMSSFHYLLQGKVQRRSSPFNYLANWGMCSIMM